jgi:hypothetical protein
MSVRAGMRHPARFGQIMPAFLSRSLFEVSGCS